MKLNRLALYALILTLFFEARSYSFPVLGARIRIIQVLACAAFPLVAIGLLCKSWPIRKSRADLFLWGYLAVNGLAMLRSQDAARSLKIALLLLSLVLLYHIVIHLAFTREIFRRAFGLLLWVGLAEISFGLAQVAAGMLNFALKTRLPIYPAGLMHDLYIGSPWGRPYGTFIESDWYGAVCAFYAVLFLALLVFGPKRKILPGAGLILALSGLFLSFVRAAWLGFAFGAAGLALAKIKWPQLRLKPRSLARPALIFVAAILILVILVPQFQTILLKRFSPPQSERMTTLEIRWVYMKQSFQSFLKSPLIGHGPGTPINPSVEFNPSLVTTLLDDTGILGFLLFALFLFELFRTAWKRIAILESRDQPSSLGLFAGLAGLFFSYIFTTGLWLPFTWVFFGLAVASLESGIPAAVSRDADGVGHGPG